MSKKYITPKIMVKRIDSLHLLAGSPEGKKEVKLEMDGGITGPTLKNNVESFDNMRSKKYDLWEQYEWLTWALWMINGVQHNVFARRFFMIEHAYFIISQTVFRPLIFSFFTFERRTLTADALTAT